MKIIIDGKVYDPNITPVLLVFTDRDKDNIHKMGEDKHYYFAFPADMDTDDAFRVKNQFKELAK
jgi:hypothetical protein